MPAETRACSKCQSENRPEARFCDGCGTPVARAAVEPRSLRDSTPRHLADEGIASCAGGGA